MRRRLILSYLAVALVVLVLLEIPLGALTYRHERDLLASQATEEATGIAVTISDEVTNGQLGGLQVLVRRYHVEAGGEVLITTAAGASAADSDNDGAKDVAGLRDPITAALSGRTMTGWLTDEHQLRSVAAVPIRPDHVDESANARPIGVVLLYLSTETTYERIHAVWLGLAAFALAILALTGLLGARVARSVIRPLATLDLAVSRLGDGRLSERATPHGPGEVRALAGSFNQMADRIEDLVSVQSRFVADASHQLRSPLTALRLRLENMEPDVRGAAAGSLAAAEREVQRLSRLVDGLLALSRADGDRPERVPVDVAQVVSDRVATWAPLASERDVDLRPPSDSLQDPVVAFVPGDLEQILDNLLANAVDATPPGCSITVELADVPAGVTVSVVDEGPGMPKAARARAFDRFWQGPGERAGSSGLGLAIVRQLALRNSAEATLLPASSSADGSASAEAGLRAEVYLTR